jgi:hypothetical protein
MSAKELENIAYQSELGVVPLLKEHRNHQEARYATIVAINGDKVHGISIGKNVDGSICNLGNNQCTLKQVLPLIELHLKVLMEVYTA